MFSTSVTAHKSSDSYLSVDVEKSEISLRWDIALQDLQNVMNLDLNGDRNIQWSELKQTKESVFAYSLARLQLSSSTNQCQIIPGNIKVNQRSDGHYVVLYAHATCDVEIEMLSIHYELFFDVDVQHRGLLKLVSNGVESSFAFSPEVSRKSFDFEKSYTGDSFFRFLSEGVWHIWIGFDHILFLLSLLLPAVLFQYQKKWQGIDSFPYALMEVIKIVTAFTIAHSLTLSLVMMGAISLPVMWVESVIAFSVIIAAANNLRPFVTKKRWILGFVFGLIHGFGFANVLSELELSNNTLFATLLGFNVGVELGQLAIVLVFMPIAYLLRNGWFYQNIVFKLGSVSIASLGFIWLIERTI